MKEHDRLEGEYERLKTKGKKSMLNGVLSPLLQAWDKAAKHYETEAEKQPNLYMRGKREGAAYKLESCANELRALIEEVG
jgi:hypothetical protein